MNKPVKESSAQTRRIVSQDGASELEKRATLIETVVENHMQKMPLIDHTTTFDEVASLMDKDSIWNQV